MPAYLKRHLHIRKWQASYLCLVICPKWHQLPSSKEGDFVCFWQKKVITQANRHGFEGNGAMKLSMSDQLFLLGLYNRDLARPLYSYVNTLYKFSGTQLCKGTICKWFKHSFNFKSTCRKSSIFLPQKFSSANIKMLIEYVKFENWSRFDMWSCINFLDVRK